MSINLTSILQNITGLNSFFRGPAASRQAGVVLLDTATVTWATDGQGNVQATSTGSTPSGAANLVEATPNGSSGAAALRALVPADLPVATSGTLGAVEPDGTTIAVNGSGVISVVPSGMVLISSQTVSGGAVASVTFSAIPQTYNNLKLVVSATASANDTMFAGFNGDFSAGNYYWNTITMAFTSGVTGTGGFGGNAGATTGNINTNGGGVELNIYGYATANGVKGYTSQNIGATYTLNGGVWTSTVAITSLVLQLASSGTFQNGSTFSLYGLK
jgi:hypothetical protein